MDRCERQISTRILISNSPTLSSESTWKLEIGSSDIEPDQVTVAAMDVPPTALHLPASLPYPLTIHRLHAQPDSQVRKTQSILTYSYLPLKPDSEGKRERVVESWDSPVEGTLVKWDLKEGQLLQEAT